MKCKKECIRGKKMSALITELRNAIDEKHSYDYLMGIVIALEIVRED